MREKEIQILISSITLCTCLHGVRLFYARCTPSFDMVINIYETAIFVKYISLVLNKKLSMNWYVCFLKPLFGLSWFVSILIESKLRVLISL